MKLIEFNHKDGTVDYYVHLTYEQEQTLAAWTMDLLSKVWFDRRNCRRDFFNAVNKLYDLKCEVGQDFSLNWYADLLAEVALWNDDHPDPLFQISSEEVMFEEDGKERALQTANAAGKKYTLEEQIAMNRQEARRAWREVWRSHPIRLKGAEDEFLVFPGDDPGEIHAEVQADRERRFWDEVERRCDETGEPRRHVIKYVSDYMPRGDIQIPDPKRGGHESLLDRMEVEYPDPD